MTSESIPLATEFSGAGARIDKHRRWLLRTSEFYVAWLVLVILWGAYVRASGSGAGCGSHWPTCDGDVVPHVKSFKMAVELTHRLTTGLAGLVGLAQLAGTFKLYSKGHAARRSVLVLFGLLVIESLIGAALVKFEYVATDARVGRGAWVSAHLVNTMLLLGASVRMVFVLRRDAGPRVITGGAAGSSVALATLGVLATGVTGAIAALGDTLFPAASLAEGFAADASAAAHVFVRLRVLHPFVAALTAVVLIAAGALAGGAAAGSRRTAARAVAALAGAQVLVGLVNLAWLAPIPLQLVHLAMADAIWIALVWLGAEIGLEPRRSAPA